MMFRKYFPTFVQRLDAKMRKGYEEYGDVSFTRDPEALLNELEQEALDFAGWGLILWTRIQKAQEALKDSKSKG